MNEKNCTPPAYPFYWLDDVVENILNPAKNNLKNLTTEEITSIRNRLPLEIAQITTQLKSQTFSLYSNDDVKVVAGHYDLAIRLLQRQAIANLSVYPQKGPLRTLGLLITEHLEILAKNLNNRCPGYTAASASEEPLAETSPITKVQCALSADQIGILLKAAFYAKVVLGKSFRAICKAIAPHLSTPWRETISWDTIRSISGRAERRDKEIAIEFLEKMILLIEDKRR